MMRMSQVFSSATNTAEFKTFTEINRQVDVVPERSISSTKMLGYITGYLQSTSMQTI
jgi:hypothetical protein